MPPPEPTPASPHEARNAAALALYTAVVRMGWIFKTESVVIPAFLDQVAGAGWLRGLLPVLSRAGMSVPPFLLARRVAVAPRKAPILLLATLGMAVPFLGLAALLLALGGATPGWLAAPFLAAYAVFFAATGLHGLTQGTLQGKLIRAERRGRLLAMATAGGVVPAATLAWFVLPVWLESSPPGWPAIFGFTGVCFTLAALVALLLREPRDRHEEPARSLAAQLGGAWRILRDDRNYRTLVIVHMLFTMSLVLLPHYQSLARERLGLMGGDLMVWVVAQNAAVAVGSLVAGPLADRAGNRLALRWLIFFSAAVPLGALSLTHVDPALGRGLFTWVFVGIGWTPIAIRLTANYVLEISPSAEHPRYLAISQLGAAAAMLTAPLFGALIDVAGYEPAFLLATGAIALGGLLTFRLDDPRARRARGPAG